MVTPEKEYNELLYVINDPNNTTDDPTYYRIPYDEPIYEINLETRTVQTPEFLSVLDDHNAEVIWFKVDRFYDDVDLYGSTCWIQYRNALKEEYVQHSIPKVIEESNHDVLYLPWAIVGPATRAAGNIQFSFQFFKMGESGEVFYSINTQPATSKILHGMHVDLLGENLPSEDEKIDLQLSDIERMLMDISEKYDRIEKGYEIYWLEA